MILEHAPLRIRPGQQAAFEAAFSQAQAIIASMPGYAGHSLQRCVEDDALYLLLVNWQTLEDHTVGFRQSAKYQEWRALLHHFYDPFPTVQHFELVHDLRQSQPTGAPTLSRSELLDRVNQIWQQIPQTLPLTKDEMSRY
jgi:heme-degrading monooxygenase HmoA